MLEGPFIHRNPPPHVPSLDLFHTKSQLTGILSHEPSHLLRDLAAFDLRHVPRQALLPILVPRWLVLLLCCIEQILRTPSRTSPHVCVCIATAICKAPTAERTRARRALQCHASLKIRKHLITAWTAQAEDAIPDEASSPLRFMHRFQSLLHFELRTRLHILLEHPHDVLEILTIHVLCKN